MDLTRLAIEKNRITVVALLVIAVAGIQAFFSMPRNEDPGFIVRAALVQTFFPGASPERVELLVTDKLEKVIQEIPELDFISSTSKVGVSIIYVNIKERYTDMRPIWDNLRRKVEDSVADLPEGVQGPFINDEFGEVFGTIVALTGDGFEYRELEDIADELKNELLLIPDVAKVTVFGIQEERIFVEYNNARLAEFGLSPSQLQQILSARNIVLPGGDIRSPYETIVLEPTGSFQSVDELKRTIINLPGSREVVHLQDVVTIKRDYVDPPTAIMHANGERSLALGISLREGGNIIDMGREVAKVVRRAQEIYPIGIELEPLAVQSDVVSKKIADFTKSLFQAIGIVALVMLAFLGMRTGLIVASLIPMTMVSSVFVMSVFDIGLDQMSLASLIIALGMLVDNAIVMSESIMVQMEGGKRVKDAAIDSARELRVPLLVSSLTTAVAFLPIYLSESATGEYTAPLFKVVTITLLCSWVMALTLIPLLCVLFLRIKASTAHVTFEGTAYRRYRRLLTGSVKRPLVSLAAVAAVFVVALQGFAFVPDIFFPENDRTTFTVEFELPEGTPIERTRTVVAETEAFIGERFWARASDESVGVINWGAFIGEGAPRFQLAFNPEPPSPNYAIILANATSIRAIDETIIPEIEQFIVETFPDVNPTIKRLPLGAPAWPPVQIRISGRDTGTLFEIVEQLKARLRETPGARQISDNWGVRTKKILVNVDDTRATRAGITNQDVAVSLQAHLLGFKTTEFREGDKLIPVVMRAEEAERKRLQSGAAINVFAQATGNSVPIDQVATPELVWQPGRIERRDRLRTVSVEALLQPGYTAAQVNASVQPWLQEQAADWPFGYSWEFGGEAETSGKANEAIAEKLPIAGLIILLLLVGQFNSIRKPIIILLTIPLAVIGVVVGLLVARSYFGFMTLLGIISLAGIVINNAIVLLDRIRIESEENQLPPAEAVIMAAQQRLRPILLTTATTIGGMLPLWFGGGPMWEPMAIAIIFGLLFATALTLVVVPVLYSVLYRVDYSER